MKNRNYQDSRDALSLNKLRSREIRRFIRYWLEEVDDHAETKRELDKSRMQAAKYRQKWLESESDLSQAFDLLAKHGIGGDEPGRRRR